MCSFIDISVTFVLMIMMFWVIVAVMKKPGRGDDFPPGGAA